VDDASLAPNRNAALAGALLGELARAGVRHVCVCPGSRSAPLAAAAARTPGVRAWSHVDERSAGFFALGLARASRAPVAVVCTSGTAAANLLPAVVEASLAGVPLVLLTADRPPELREWGAPQTIDQVRLFGPYVRLFAEAPTPEVDPAHLRHARALAARAVAVASARPEGPVHLNLPFREPLEPVPCPGDVPSDLAARDPEAARGRGALPWLRVREGVRAPAADDVARLADAIAAAPEGLLAAGPLDAPPALAGAAVRLARAAGWPLFAEPTSQLRRGPHVPGAPLASAYDAFLRDARVADACAPALVLRLGAPLTSKPFAQWLARHPAAELVLLDPDGRYADPAHRGGEILRADPTLLCRALAEELEARGPAPARTPWLAALLDAERRSRAALARALGDDERLLEPRLALELGELLGEGSTLFVSSSMPVRDLDAFLPPSPRGLRVLANRGANGIDGIVSSALGAAAGSDGPLALLTGDLALLHDLGGLLAAKRHGLSATFVVVNNGGGGIFSFLPVADWRDEVDFDTHFTTPHGLDLAHAARLFDARHARPRSWEAFRLALKSALAEPGLDLVEVCVDREANVAHHRELWAAVSEALAGWEAPR
jgi:2-succinyl-5-enolpyruvyl-6-hydroxy-3-cyclohexene-1-carboxylate synthase